MRLLINGSVACLLLCLGGTAIGGNPDDPPTDDTAKVTTDSPEYCRTLAENLDHDPKIIWTADLRSLADMGRDLCRNGHVKLGISRLRYVWTQGHTDNK